MSYLLTFGLEFGKKTIAIFEISTFGFICSQNFAKKQKCQNFRPKMLYLGTFQ